MRPVRASAHLSVHLQEMTVPQALGVWGRLDLHDRIARVAAEALGSGNRVPIAPLSHVAKLQEMAAELAAEEGWGRGLVHPYLELLLNTKTTLDRESSLPLPLEPPGTLIARTGARPHRKPAVELLEGMDGSRGCRSAT